MKTGAVVSTGVAIVASSAMVYAFLTSASPYVSLAQARNMPNRSVHLSGDLVKDSVRVEPGRRTMAFRLRDENGEIVRVVHKGELPSNMTQATKIVAVGTLKKEEFHSRQLLVKCPSKYEDEKRAQPKD